MDGEGDGDKVSRLVLKTTEGFKEEHRPLSIVFSVSFRPGGVEVLGKNTFG